MGHSPGMFPGVLSNLLFISDADQSFQEWPEEELPRLYWENFEQIAAFPEQIQRFFPYLESARWYFSTYTSFWTGQTTRDGM